MNINLQTYNKFRNFILYGIIGCFTASLDFVVFSLLTGACNIHYIISNCLSVLVGISTSFFLNSQYNFKVKDNQVRRFSIFLFIGLCGLCLSNVILWICIEVVGLNEIISKILSIILVVFFQFILNKYVTFKTKR